MAIGWSVDGTRIEIKPGWPAGRLKVGEALIKLKAAGEWPVKVGERTLTFKRTRRFMGPKQELFDGELMVPPSTKLVTPTAPPQGSRCATHTSESATISCARCGAFACTECSRPDGAHCRVCAERFAKEAREKAAAMAFLAPIPIFFVLAGLLGGLLGGVAGGLSYWVARKVESRGLKLGVSITLYLLAGGLTLALVYFLQTTR